MIDRDIAAQTAKMTIVGKGRNQTEIAKSLGFDRIFLNAFLNRRIDLLPQDIERLLKELGILNAVVRLSKQQDSMDEEKVRSSLLWIRDFYASKIKNEYEPELSRRLDCIESLLT